jgi:hypothetical protein
MFIYPFSEESELINQINTKLDIICKNKKINKEKQNYLLLVNSEIVKKENNDLFFVSAEKKSLSFYGRVYKNIVSEIKECVDTGNSIECFLINSPSIVIIESGIKSKTEVNIDTQVQEFYIAPKHLLLAHDLSQWHEL